MGSFSQVDEAPCHPQGFAIIFRGVASPVCCSANTPEELLPVYFGMKNISASNSQIDSIWNQNRHVHGELQSETDSLEEVASRIVLEVEEIDAFARMGDMDVCGDFSRYSARIKKHGIDRLLASLAGKGDSLECPKRGEWMDSCLNKFKHYLRTPSVSFEARKTPHGFEVVKNGEEVILRHDLMLAQRYWGIHFYSNNRKHDMELANQYLSAAMTRLSSDIASINRFCAEWVSDSEFLKTVSFSHERKGNMFEQLVLGVLNQVEPTVVQTSMYDDVRKWSDLRVVKNGAFKKAKIQVKFVHRASDQGIAENHPKAGRVIVISPFAMARCLEEDFDPVLFRCSWSDVLSLFPERPDSTESLSFQIYRLLDSSFDAVPEHPLSPIAGVPFPIRVAIHLIVVNQAVELMCKDEWKASVARNESAISGGGSAEMGRA